MEYELLSLLHIVLLLLIETVSLQVHVVFEQSGVAELLFMLCF